MHNPFPKLRPEVDAVPANCEGCIYYILFDRSGLSQARLLVTPVGLLLAGRLDGTLCLLDAADILTRETDFGLISSSEIEELVREFDDALFLEGPRFDDFRAQAIRDFRAAPLRKVAFSGQAYQDDPVLLARDLESILAQAPFPEEAIPKSTRIRGIIAPHLDHQRGAPGYGQIYRLLCSSPPPTSVIILGTAHCSLSASFSLCCKDFETPLGTIPADQTLCGSICEAAGRYADISGDILPHLFEHSLEMQAVWLRYLWEDKVPIVPILVNNIGQYLHPDANVSEIMDDPLNGAVARSLADAVEKGALIIASADLAHIGLGFDAGEVLSADVLAQVEHADRLYLNAAASDPAAGVRSLSECGDSRQVCGAAPIFILKRALENSTGVLLGYHQAVTGELEQAVTFAAMAFI